MKEEFKKNMIYNELTPKITLNLEENFQNDKNISQCVSTLQHYMNILSSSMEFYSPIFLKFLNIDDNINGQI
jgi:hypothetical protein